MGYKLNSTMGILVTDEYPSESQLKLIQEWDAMDIIPLVDYIKSVWNFRPEYCSSYWSKTKFKKPSLKVELHTGGWSGNEEIIYTLKKTCFWRFYWTKSERGGHYYFEVVLSSQGYLPLAEFAKNKQVSKQWIHKSLNQYDYIKYNGTRIYVREKHVQNMELLKK